MLLLVAANAPDIDVLSLLGGPANALIWHRNFTHSLAFAPFLAVLAVAFVRYILRRKVAWVAGSSVALAGVVSHLLLDLTNNYGIRLWLPFSGVWLHLDTVFVLDIWIWVVLLMALAAPFLSGLVSSEIGRGAPNKYPGTTWPVIGIAALAAINCTQFVFHARALATLDARVYAGEAPKRIAAFPTQIHPLEWSGLVETSDRYILYDLDLTTEFDPSVGRTFFKSEPGEIVSLLSRSRDFGALVDFDQYKLWRVTQEGDLARYRLTDLRFGDPQRDTFTCTARVRKTGTLVEELCDLRFAPAWH